MLLPIPQSEFIPWFFFCSLISIIAHVVAHSPIRVHSLVFLLFPHLLLRQSLLDIHGVPVDEMTSPQCNLIHCIVIIELNEAISPLLATVSPHQLVNFGDCSKLPEILLDIIIGDIIIESLDHNLLDGSLLILWFTFWSGSPGLCVLTVDVVRSVALNVVHRLGIPEGNKPEPSGLASIIKLHDLGILNISELTEVVVKLLL